MLSIMKKLLCLLFIAQEVAGGQQQWWPCAWLLQDSAPTQVGPLLKALTHKRSSAVIPALLCIFLRSEGRGVCGRRRLMPGSSQCDGRVWISAHYRLLACCRWHRAHVNHMRYSWCACVTLYFKLTLFRTTPKSITLGNMCLC